MPERSTRRTTVTPRADYGAALVMLRKAVGAAAVADLSQVKDGGADVIIQRPGTSPLSLQLKSWGLPVSRRGQVVWIISRGDRRLRAALRARGEQFIDLSGAVRIVSNGLHIDREDLEPVRASASTRQTLDPFADKSSLVLRVMLAERDVRERVWGIRELASAAGVAPATASDVIRTLAERRLVEVLRAGRSVEVRVPDPWRVIDSWTRAYDWRLNRGMTVDAPIGDPAMFLPRLTKAMATMLGRAAKWALTMHAGAFLERPHSTWDRVHVYIDARTLERSVPLTALVGKVGWHPSNSGKLVLMLPYYPSSVWQGMRRISRLPVVSALQLGLDLWHYPARGREQAAKVLEGMFGPERQRVG